MGTLPNMSMTCFSIALLYLIVSVLWEKKWCHYYYWVVFAAELRHVCVFILCVSAAAVCVCGGSRSGPVQPSPPRGSLTILQPLLRPPFFSSSTSTSSSCCCCCKLRGHFAGLLTWAPEGWTACSWLLLLLPPPGERTTSHVQTAESMAHGKVTIAVDEYSSNPTQAFTHYNINQSRFQPPHVHM